MKRRSTSGRVTDKNREITPLRATFGIVAAVVLLTGLFAAGYGLTTFIFRFTGHPPEIFAHILSGFTGFFLFALVANLFRVFGKHSENWKQREILHNNILRAMKKIAQGDFDVLIDLQEDFVHNDIAEALNQMAENLGTFESMRQDFISNVSHEIQSPLTSISGFAALMKKNELTGEQRDHYLDIIESESKRLSSLSDNLLKLSVLETGNSTLAIKEYRLDKQIENTALVLEPQWNAKNLNLDLSLDKTMIGGDEALLSQVWVNLLHNAVKFTPENGDIQITLTSAGEQAICRVSDNGAGISPEDQMHIFERFYKADKARDRSFGGNGLGLSIVKKIVELHGGEVAVESEIGKGTTFTVTLSLCAAPSVSRE